MGECERCTEDTDDSLVGVVYGVCGYIEDREGYGGEVGFGWVGFEEGSERCVRMRVEILLEDVTQGGVECFADEVDGRSRRC